MAIIQNTMKDVKRYIGSNEQADDTRKEEALRALSLFACPQIAENTAMQAVVGFDERNAPLFWDMTEGNFQPDFTFYKGRVPILSLYRRICAELSAKRRTLRRQRQRDV